MEVERTQELGEGRYFNSWLSEEPKLVFGNGHTHIDQKAGLTLYGPCVIEGRKLTTPSTIQVGIIGCRDTVHLAELWLERCKTQITNKGEHPFLFPEFPGFQRVFNSVIEVADEWKQIIPQRDIDAAIKQVDFSQRVRSGVALFVERLKNLAELEPAPQVVICALPQEIVDYCGTRRSVTGVQVRKRLTKEERDWIKTLMQYRAVGQQTLFPIDDSLLSMLDFVPGASDFRRILKGEAMSTGIPTQLAKPSTFTGEEETQDDATRAWNFSVALYYKSGGYLWRIVDSNPGTCYIGISFYHDLRSPDPNMRTALAQIFSHTGEGLVLRGARFNWNQAQGKSPHLSKEGAGQLLADALQLYERHMNQRPRRLILHKTSRYWDDELEGFNSIVSGIPEVDYVAFGERGIRVLRCGSWPPLRGTAMSLTEKSYLLYTKGYVPYLQTYPGFRIPRPLEILEHHGDSTPRTISKEILGLTKMNWNTADFSCAEPMTLQFAREVGRILAHLPAEAEPQTKYMFYM